MQKSFLVFLWFAALSSPVAAQESSLPKQTSPSEPTSILGRVVESVKEQVATDPESPDDPMRQMQSKAMQERFAAWGHWGNQPSKYSTWTNHSNRLVPLYTFGITLGGLRDQGSLYSSESRLKSLFGGVPNASQNANAVYHDQTDVYDLQKLAVKSGKKYIITMIFDGMDWQTTRAAATYRNQADLYDTGRGQGLLFQDYRGVTTDFAYLVTTPLDGGAKYDVNSQTVQSAVPQPQGGFDPNRSGPMPWHESPRSLYPTGRDREQPHKFTDSASSASSLLSGIKTYNGSINIKAEGTYAVPIARDLQADGFRVGVVTSVPISHATPAAAYANNVTRKDYQDISRDMLGLPSSSHRRNPLPGLDVLIGGGWGEGIGNDKTQGDNFLPGNKYLHESDRDKVKSSGNTVVAERTEQRDGADVLKEAADLAIKESKRLFGFFGTKGGHLPFQTADGNYRPTFDVKGAERYSDADVTENPTLAEMTTSAIDVLSASSEKIPSPFWLLIECGDVDWANHANNIDNSIGAVFSGEEAFGSVIEWVENHDAWDDTVVFITSDHGHHLNIVEPQTIADAASRSSTMTTSE